MKLVRSLTTEVRVLDAAKGIAEYIASDETIDSYREVIRASGWRFDNFRKNAPFVDSHDYGSIDKLVGKVTDFKVDGKRLVETVQWTIDVPGNDLAQLGWAMTEAGYLRAVSVGFWPTKMVSKWDSDPTGYVGQLTELGLSSMPAEQKPRTIYTEQQQVELSAVIIGANPNALAKAYKAGILKDADIDYFAEEYQRRETARAAARPDDAARAAKTSGQRRFLERFERTIKKFR